MHQITELPAWERLFKRIVWAQIGELKGLSILDFGSGEGVTASHYAADNAVTAVEPSEEMLAGAWRDHEYTQIAGDVSALAVFADGSFDFVICHNVLEYIDDKRAVICELARVLKPGGRISIVKHHRAGRVMQMAVLLDDMERANALLDGKNSTASRFGAIRYYSDGDIAQWSSCLKPAASYGIRTFWDLQQNQEKHDQEEWQEKMAQLEMRVSQLDEYRNIAFFHHLVFVKEKVYEFDTMIRVDPESGGAYVAFPWDLRSEFGKGRMKVHAKFDGIPYDGSIVNMGVKNADGSVCYVIGVLKDIRNRLGKGDGDSVHVVITAAGSEKP